MTRNCAWPSQRDAERYTGLQVGGISALALLNRGFGIYIDAEALTHEQILVSAGNEAGTCACAFPTS